MTDAPTRTLILLRHAKAADPAGRVDLDRPLTERGEADAAVAGAWLKSEGLTPTQVLCSPALRTRQTWAAVVEASGQGGLVDHDQRIYSSSDRQLLELIREVEDDAKVVALVGHSPSIPYLAATLDDGEGDADARAALDEGFPTCTAAVFKVSTDWADLAPGAARLVAVRTSRA
jgi:phosphohistidine phosphatase